MLTSIQFDDQPRVETDEVSNGGTDGTLTPEPRTSDVVATQEVPEVSLSVRWMSTQRSCTFLCKFVAHSFAPRPPP